MTANAEILIKLLEENPEEQTLWNMLVDELLESGEPEWEAHDTANYHRKVGREARTLAQATNLMRADLPSGQYLRSVCERAVGNRHARGLTIIVISSDNGPITVTGYDPTHRLNWRNRTTITVGARWVVTTWEEKTTRDARHAAARDRRRA